MSNFGTGNTSAKIMLVGECFTREEEEAGEAFLGKCGIDLNNMLFEAGIMRGDCYSTNVVNLRPPFDDINNLIAHTKKGIKPGYIPVRNLYVSPEIVAGVERLYQEIDLLKPKVIIAFGNIALWALTGATGIVKWRGSQLQCLDLNSNKKGIVIIPTLPPYMVTYIHENRAMVVSDLRTVKRIAIQTTPYQFPGSNWNFIVRPSFPKVMSVLQALTKRLDGGLELWIDFDLETRAGHIACAGISWTKTDALCIPFMCVNDYNGYWGLDEEANIVHALYKLLTHKNVKVRGQNLLFDCQYTYRHWHFFPNVKQDIMISHHTCFLGLPKSLAFQASIYCEDYLYWKDDGKTWTKSVGEDQLWAYNAVDCIRTRQCGESQLENLRSMGLEEVDAFQQRLFWAVLEAMRVGVKVDLKARTKLTKELTQEIKNCEAWFEQILSHPLNPRSSPQMAALFYKDLGCQPVYTRAKKGVPARVTCNDEALNTIGKREPLALPIVKRIADYRTLGVFLSTFIKAKLDIDDRMRCSYNICGTETLRFSSSKNAFDSGTNLQNVPKETSNLPSVKKLFIPDEGNTFFDMDLDRADLQVVVWEADEPELKSALKRGVDMHLLNAFALLGKDVDLGDLVEGTENCERFKHDFKKERNLAKAFIHGTNYGGGARTMAIAAGITVHMAERFQKQYFDKYPGIKRWHERVQHQLDTKRYVENILGYRRYYFEKVDGLLPEALAWVPQSTVACVINRAWVNIYEHCPNIQVLLQVHDSLAGQFPTGLKEESLKQLVNESKILLPYEDPLIIPAGVKISKVSWGDCV